ncbi:MAG: response regulator, partial [Rubrivivax sp.]
QQAGLVVEVADNGQAALDRLAEASYDVVLMDLQMPVMDGFTATARIREHPDWQELPVIAMTANVMAEDRARVKAVGMNGHIAKPVVPAELFKTLLRHVRKVARPAEAAATVSALAPDADTALPAHLPDLDLQEALANIGGNRALLRKLLADLAQDHAQDGHRLQAALETGDRVLAERMAHTLKGVAGTLGAKRLQTASAALEAALRVRDGSGHGAAAPHDLGGLVSGVKAALQPLMEELVRWCADQGLNLGAPAQATVHQAPPEAPDAQGRAPALSAGQRAQALKALADLQRRLAEFDPEAADRAEALASMLGPQVSTAQALALTTARFEFEAAQTLLLTLQGEMSAWSEAAPQLQD